MARSVTAAKLEMPPQLAPMRKCRKPSSIAEIAASGIAVLLVEQNLKAALALADHVVVMERGRTAFAGGPATLRGDPGLVHRLLGVGIP